MIIEKLLKQIDNLRSQISKNAMLALTDCYIYFKDGAITDPLIT